MKKILAIITILIMQTIMLSFLIIEVVMRGGFAYSLTIGIFIFLIVYVKLDDIIKRHF